ncbi:hypothetical protein L2E82_31450 [Cichorium intybus]|uniref:Uncharacterized protein n=1 Tax=Cichorium intybus TaxID=13427 RepID=A0ACB9D3F4_CICIN|nr:hypothetical protein L2E82_31450 [Cichorium intybus]
MNLLSIAVTTDSDLRVSSPGITSFLILPNHQYQSNLSLCSPFSSDGNNEEVVSGAKISTEDGTTSPSDKSDPNVPPGVTTSGGNSSGNGSRKEEKEKSGQNETEKQESFKHNLPDNLFASPTKSAATNH